MEKIYTILPKYFNNQCTGEEVKMVKQWKKENPAEFKEHQTIWSLTAKHDYVEFDAKAGWAELQPQLKNEQQTTKVVALNQWFKFAAAAVVVVVSAWGIINYMSNPNSMERFAEEINRDNFDSIRGAEMSSEFNVEQLRLESGDRVWLNKGSKVEDLGKKDGKHAVKLHKGEAFFDVQSKNGDESFIVHTKNAAVSVIGTEFSVVHKKEKTIIRVVEGTVEVDVPGTDKKMELKEGEQASVVNGKIEKKDSFSPNFLAWKTGKFLFNDMDLDKTVFILKTFYNVEIELESGVTGSVNGKFNNDSIDDILHLITRAAGLELNVIEKDKAYKITK